MKLQVLFNQLTKHYCDKILMPEGATLLLQNIAKATLEDEKLLEIYKTFYTHYIENGYWMTDRRPLEIHPYVAEKFKEHASLFYLHIAFEKLPFAEAEYTKRGISDDIFVETLRDVSTWVTNAYHLVGYYALRNFSWIWRHFEAKLFRLGRMQYMPKPFPDDIYAFYHKVSGQIALLADTGLALRANGDSQGVCGKEPTLDGFVTTFLETPTHYIGHPIMPYGKCESHTVSLSKSEWECVLQKGDYLLDLHIPQDGNFNLSTLQQSYEEAKNFFTKHFPEYNIQGLYCGTWLFTPQLQEFLSPTSKIVAFQRSFYLYPFAGSKEFIWNFVFNELLNPKDAIATTQLQKQVLMYVLEDKELFDLKGIYLDISGDFGIYSYMDAYDKTLE